MGWRNSQDNNGVWCVDSVVEHDCPAEQSLRARVKGTGQGAGGRGKAGGKGKAGAVKRNTSWTAYHRDMLARVVTNTVLADSPWLKQSLKIIQTTLKEYVGIKVSRMRGMRVRDACLKMMYGEWAQGV